MRTSPLRRTRFDWPAVLLAAGLLSTCAAAAQPPAPSTLQTGGGASGSTSEKELETRIRERDRDLKTRLVMLGRARFSHPQTLSAGFGVMRVRQPRHYDCTTACDYRGPYVQLEPGLDGAQLSLGWGILVGEQGRSDFLHSVYSGFAIKAALLRTWGKLQPDYSDESFFGLEASIAIARANISIGIFHPFSRAAGDDGWLITGGMGWGF